MRERMTVEMILRAEQPISHGAGNEGNFGIIKRRKMQADDGSFVEVPYVSGDSLRHQLREAGSMALLQASGLLDDPQLSEAALRLLFNGGMVSGSSKAVSVAEWAELRELLPHVALLGGCVSNTIREGTVTADSALLVCEETLPFLPPKVGAWLESIGRRVSSEAEHVTIEERTRMDPTTRPTQVRLLASGAQKDVEERRTKRESASRAGDDAAALASKGSGMPFEYETICARSLWYWRVSAWVHSEIERDAFAVMLAAYLADPHMGGKIHQGNGRVSVAHVWGDARPAERVDEGATLTADGITSPEVARYIAHVGERRERIRDLLASVVA